MASPDKQIDKNHHFGQSLKHAAAGLFCVFLREGNFRRESVMALLVFIMAWWLQVGRFQWFILMLAVMLVFLMELWNTIIENVVDLVVGRRFDVRAKAIKDMSAGAVLVASGIAVLCGAYVFIPPLWHLLTRWF
ncbi:diacylglycerol kinase family protein [Lacticaseibacillus jixianensis]|uniref:Diacylglycerol kinase family protein n=1 Tax=Lacticaseibacillus jixianensis TaxID=2486012 RepID=A0ABW4BAG2_9LACO|nr:diacylglycerol kinase family protein [Lacticaseibacillus jixianensis]